MTKLPFWPNIVEIKMFLGVYIHFYNLSETRLLQNSSSHSLHSQSYIIKLTFNIECDLSKKNLV